MRDRMNKEHRTILGTKIVEDESLGPTRWARWHLHQAMRTVCFVFGGVSGGRHNAKTDRKRMDAFVVIAPRDIYYGNVKDFPTCFRPFPNCH